MAKCVLSSFNRFKVTTIDQNRLLSHGMDISRSGNALPDFLKYIIVHFDPQGTVELQIWGKIDKIDNKKAGPVEAKYG